MVKLTPQEIREGIEILNAREKAAKKEEREAQRLMQERRGR